ncbi:MAG: bifunctional oligoribonuclease/PAP phosphatase NrnA [Chitinophagaceae bacterium]|nr:bifunctional oligoribonuclease/PAP phosphatase NrnA [Chitinophagaceae bacterium]
MKPIEHIYPQLENCAGIVIVPHQKPDADAMGASLALFHMLKKQGHSPTVVSPTNWASWLNWMPGIKEVLDYEKEKDKVKADNQIADASLIFCLDYNVLHRTKKMEQALSMAKGLKVLIDHHEYNESSDFAFGISDPERSSTCELVYEFFCGWKKEQDVDADIAQCIYAGLVGDTGSFRFPSTSARVHEIVAALKKKGLNHSYVHEQLYDNFLENRLRFIGHVLLNRMEVFYEYNTVLIAIPKSDLYKYEIKTGDTEGLVNYPLSIQGIKLAALVIDREEERKWSFRSKGDFDCNRFARKYFEGGGHFNAAGGRSSDTLSQTVQQFKKAMAENKDLLQ